MILGLCDLESISREQMTKVCADCRLINFGTYADLFLAVGLWLFEHCLCMFFVCIVFYFLFLS